MKACKIVSGFIFLISLLMISSSAAMAASISYSLTDLSSQEEGLWQIDYQVSDFNSDTYQGFQIIFDYGMYENITLESYTEGWDAFENQPDVIWGSEDPGMIDAEVLELEGILTASFSVTAVWLSSDMPGVQQFLLYDENYETVGGGTTAPVPVPSSFFLMLSGLAAIVAGKRKSKN